MLQLRRLSTASVAALTLTFSAVITAACGSEDLASGMPEDAGALGVALELGPGISVHRVSYEITGNGFVKTGSFDVQKSKTINAVIGGIPAGTGYVVTLTAFDAVDARIKCLGSAGFNVLPRSTSSAVVRLLCTLPGKNGGVRVTATSNVCPAIDAVSAEPAETTLGGTVALSSAVTDTDQLPAAASYTWTSSSGGFSDPSAPNPVFTCTEAGNVTLTLNVTDGECGDSLSSTVICSATDTDPQPGIKINEIESNGGTPGDWVELYNPAATAVDVSGWTFRDDDDTHVYTLPAGSTIAAGGYLLLEEAAFGFGLGGADSARLADAAGAAVDSHAWTAHAATTYARCPNGGGSFVTATSVTKGAANDCSVPVKINEVESNGGSPGDWVELYNAGTLAVDLSGLVFKDNDDTHAYAIPQGTTLAPGGFFVLEEAAFGFGLGAAESARLYALDGVTLIDSHSWTAHATTTYGRCPDGSGAFATSSSVTKGAANSCVPTAPTAAAWPGQDDVTTADGTSVFGGNLSGLAYEPASAAGPAVLWAVRNGPGTLYRLIDDGTIWTPATTDDWSSGKALRYTDGTGNPDSEGVTRAEYDSTAIYVATERNNDASTISRLSVLRFDTRAAGAALTASHDWNLTADLPVVGANLGLEAIAWLPDSYLVARSFFDEAAGHTYDPAEYPGHGGGLFLVGVEGTGAIHAYALDHAGGGFRRLATIGSGQTGVMDLSFERDRSLLWAICDDTCGNLATVLDIDTTPGAATFGRFVVRRVFARPSTLPNVNNEGLAIAPESECAGGFKSVFWADDGETSGHSLRRGSLACGPL